MGTKSHHSQGASARIAAGTGRRSFDFFFYVNHIAGRAPLPKLTGQHKLDSIRGKRNLKVGQEVMGRWRVIMGIVGEGRVNMFEKCYESLKELIQISFKN